MLSLRYTCRKGLNIHQKVGKDLEARSKDFPSESIYGMSSNFTGALQDYDRGGEKVPQLLVRPDAPVANVENKIDSLAEQLADIARIVK